MFDTIVRLLKRWFRFLWAEEEKADSAPRQPRRKRRRRRRKKGRLLVRQAEAIDGDTIKGVVRGERVKIRLLLIDTPETRHPRLGKQPYGEEAKQFVVHRLSIAKRVEVELQNAPDRYGRLLGHVFVSGQNLNRLLLRRGYARFAYRYRSDPYEDRYREAEAQAREEGLGIWSVRGYVQEDGFHPEVVEDWTG